MLVAVTGASGYIAGHIIKQLLEHGHSVRGVVRDLSNKTKYDYLEKYIVNNNQQSSNDLLTFVQVNDLDYHAAFEKVDAIIHTATPYFYTAQDPQKEIVDPAVNLTRAVLEAALANQVKRVVVTSSGGAIFTFPIPQGKIFTHNDWNHQSSLTNNPYFYSKRLAEEVAWNFYKEQKDKIELVVVNPVYVLGPSLNPFMNTSVVNLKKYLLGEHESIQPGSIAVVDVRDVATAHVLAVEKEQAVGKRLICSGSVSKWADIPQTLQEFYPEYGVKKYTIESTTPQATSTAAFEMDTQPLKELGLVEYVSFQQTIKDTVESLFEHGLIEKL